MRMATVHQLVLFSASPKHVYDALMDSASHAEFTGMPAEISADVGGRFSAHGPHISGTNVELEPGRRIVQRWRLATWPTGHYSVVTFAFEEAPEGTLLRFVHRDIPSDRAKEVDVGWVEQYWKPLKKYLSASAKSRVSVAKKPKSKPAKKKSKAKSKPKKR
jgi:activator of HSP90 ATPase